MNVDNINTEIASADRMRNSPGKEKKRFDLSHFLDDEQTKKGLDEKKHLFVAVEKDLVEKDLNDKPLREGLRGTLITVGEKGNQKQMVLNTNSLAKRLGISKRELRQGIKKKGDAVTFIKEKLNKIKGYEADPYPQV